MVWVHGLATFAWDAGDEAARRLAAVQLIQLKAATQTQVAAAFGVIPLTRVAVGEGAGRAAGSRPWSRPARARSGPPS